MSFCWTTGTIVRETTFQSGVSLNGMTGWMLSVKRSPSRAGPILPSQLSWNGTLISDATGFDSSLASAAASLTAGAPAVAASGAPCASAAVPVRARIAASAADRNLLPEASPQ